MLDRPRITIFLSDLGIDLVGIADLTGKDTKPVETYGPWPRALVMGYVLSRAVLETVTDRPSLLYKHHYKTVNWLLDQAAERLAHDIEMSGHRSLAIPASQTVDRERRQGHLSHRYLGYLAGLGFRGRSGLLVNPKYGARVRYATILSDLPVDPDQPIDDTCGPCRRCVQVCPAGAISENGVDTDKCYRKLNEFAALPGIGQHICGVCVKACLR